MPNYHPAAKSLVYGLSDFWTMYFKELPLIEELYRGVEIDAGQAYLDLLSLLLNNSLQDATLFNRQYFKLVRLREDAVTYANDGRYGVAVDPSIASLRYLNNRVFGSTASLERDRDFIYDLDARSVLFETDIFSVYRARDFGTFTVLSRLADPLGANITVEIVDSATQPPTLTRTQYALTIDIDSSITTASEVVALINGSTVAQGIVRARLPDVTQASFRALVTPHAATNLQRQATAPLEGFASRTFDVLFGTRFDDTLVSRWLDTDVQKGDVLRVIGGGDYGPPQEFPISLVRDNGLILYSQISAKDQPVSLEYAVLRSSSDDTVTNEPLSSTGAVQVVFDASASIDAATRTITLGAPAFTLTGFHIGDSVTVGTALNAGEYRIREVLTGPARIVVDGNPMVDETGVEVALRSAIDAWSVTNTGTLAGTTFTDPAGTFIPAHAGGVLTIAQGLTFHRSVITRYVSATELEIAPADSLTDASGLSWSAAPLVVATHTLAHTSPQAWVTPGTVVVNARRYLDGEVVVEGRDYSVNYDLGSIILRSPWQASTTATVGYSFRNAVVTSRTPLQAGADGTLLDAPLTFSSPALALTEAAVGAVIVVSGAALPANNGPYRIDTVVSATTAEVTRLLGAATAPDGNNGVLTWELQSRASAVITDVIEPVTELGVWAPDALVDKYHLYYTYGYLIDRVQVSSESYRALIRGVFQLFMLGPTLERFESAVSVVAGLPVVRDDDELFLEYSNGALRSGSDGSFDGPSKTFTSPTANFTANDLSNKIFVPSGVNANKTFMIAAVLDSTTVVLLDTPVTTALADWEITATGEHTVRTSRATYTFPRTAPVKAKFLDPANIGVLTLRAFEVISAAFEVTDYVETPRWWERTTIPEQLLPGWDIARRRVSPSLIENTVSPPDDGHVGDPGYFVGADTEGSVPTVTVLASGADGFLWGDPLYPSSNTQTYFEAASASFTDNDIGNEIVVDDTHYRIVARSSATRVQIVSYLPLPYDGGSAVSWELVTGTLALRHTASYVVFDRVLKHHMFTVRFDAFLLQVLQTDVIQDLQELVFEAKPSYTYLVLTPSLIFEEVIKITEPEFSVGSVLQLAGQGGEDVIANLNPLTVDGSWYVGGWYRYVENSGVFVAPVAGIIDALGTPDPGMERLVSKIYIEPAEFTAGGVPVPYDYHRKKILGGTTPGAEISVVGGETYLYWAASPGFTDALLLNYVELLAPSVNAGTWRIGRIIDDFTVVLDLPGATPEVGVDFVYRVGGARSGVFSVDASGQSFFDDVDGQYTFALGDPLDVGSFIRRQYPTATKQQVYRIDERVSDTRVRVATRHYITAAATPIDILSHDGLAITLADVYVNETMTYADRLLADPTTAKQRQYFLEFTTGSNAGATVSLQRYVSPNSFECTLSAGVPEENIQGLIYYREHYTGVTENGSWEQYVPQVTVDNHTGAFGEVALPTTGVDAGNVNYTAYGIQRTATPITVPADIAAGDTYYCVGGVDPSPQYLRNRTAVDVSLREDPVQITVTNADFYIMEDEPAILSEDGFNFIPEDGTFFEYYFVTEDDASMLTEDNFYMILEGTSSLPTLLNTEDDADFLIENGATLEIE